MQPRCPGNIGLLYLKFKLYKQKVFPFCPVTGNLAGRYLDGVACRMQGGRYLVMSTHCQKMNRCVSNYLPFFSFFNLLVRLLLTHEPHLLNHPCVRVLGRNISGCALVGVGS